MHFESKFLNPNPTDLSTFLERFPPEAFDRGEVVLRKDRRGPCIGYVVEGFVRGVWENGGTDPRHRRTAVVTGDGRWFGLDAFHHGENIYRYEAAAPTTAFLVPLARFFEEAPRSVLLGVLASAAMDWCTTAGLARSRIGSLRRRVLLLLHEKVRLHPRPEIEMRQQDLADLLGVTRQTLHPVLKKLRETGVLDLGYAEMVVGDADALLAEMEREEETGPTVVPPSPGFPRPGEVKAAAH